MVFDGMSQKQNQTESEHRDKNHSPASSHKLSVQQQLQISATLNDQMKIETENRVGENQD